MWADHMIQPLPERENINQSSACEQWDTANQTSFTDSCVVSAYIVQRFCVWIDSLNNLSWGSVPFFASCIEGIWVSLRDFVCVPAYIFVASCVTLQNISWGARGRNYETPVSEMVSHDYNNNFNLRHTLFFHKCHHCMEST